MKLPASKYWSMAIIVAVSAVVYLNALFNGFVFDDNNQILKNPWITDIRYLSDILFSSLWEFREGAATIYYRPTLHLLYMVEYNIFGFEPWGWHLTNVILHSLNSVVVFLIATELLGTINGKHTGGRTRPHNNSLALGALSAALIFAVHPINTEAVAWVGCATELSFTSFFLLSFYLYIRLHPFFDREGTPPGPSLKALYYALSLMFFFLAALSKETALTLPFILVVYDWARTKSLKRLPIKTYIPYIAVMGGYFALRSYAMEGTIGRELYIEDVALQLSNIFPVVLLYIKQLFLPVRLSVFYVYEPVVSLSEPRLLLSIAFLSALATGLWRLQRVSPISLVFAALIFIPLMPTFIFFFANLAVDHVSMPVDRYLYLSSAGFAMLAGIAIKSAVSKTSDTRIRGVILAGVFIVIALGGAGSVKRTFDWRDDFTLWRSAVRVSPENHYAHYTLSGLYLEEGRTQEALEEMEEVVRLRPGSTPAHHKLGLLYHSAGQVRKAEREFRRVLRVAPENTDARYNLGIIYMGYGQWNDAIRELKAALANTRSDSAKLKILNRLAVAHIRLGDTRKAEARLREALKIAPEDRELLDNLRALKYLRR